MSPRSFGSRSRRFKISGMGGNFIELGRVIPGRPTGFEKNHDRRVSMEQVPRTFFLTRKFVVCPESAL
jgi:hypothetical protein